MSFTSIHRAAVALALVAIAGCTVKSTEPPPLSGPSGLALLLSLNAIPDSISQDGGSQSSVRVTAIGADGKPVSALPVRMDMMVNGVAQDYGTLSARTIVTNTDGVATVVYTAPPAPPNGIYTPCASSSFGSTLPGSCVSIVATATSTNFLTANPESVLIRLVPLGVILPPAAAPTAAFTFSPTTVSAGLPVQFDASTSCGGPLSSGQCPTSSSRIVTYSWNFGDGTSGTGKNVTRTFSAGNSFVVTLTVTNDRGLSASVSQTLAVNAQALPTPSFTVSPSAPAVNQTVFFNGLASTAGQGHTIESLRWNFGDGTSGSGSTVTHVFVTAGTYVVQLTVTDDAGASVTSAGTAVTVGAAPTPTANFTFSPSAPLLNQSVSFNAASSTAGTGHTLSSYAWNFGDAATATGVTPSHAYTAAGTYTVTLTVTDEIAQTSVTSKTVSVTSSAATPPTASFTFSPSAPAPNQSVSFNAASSTAGTGHTLSSYAWNFGDAATATGVTPSHAYTAAGTYTVTLTVTDEIGQSSVTSKTVTISSSAATPPTATFTFSPAAPGVNETVFFNASTSTPGAGHTIASYAWTFGDNGTATGVTASHAYATAGTYSVQLKVTDEAGQSTTSAATTITVGSPPAPTANFTSSPTAPVVNQTVVFDASTSTTSQGQTITNLAWNFGDGTDVINCPNANNTDCGATSRIASHKFATAGTFTVNLVVTDSAGRVGAKSAQVTVASGNPVPSFTVSPTSPTRNVSAVFNASGTTTSGGATVSTYVWAWGDGTANTTLAAGSPSTTHTYTSAGTFTVTLTVTDSVARTGVFSNTVVVQ